MRRLLVPVLCSLCLAACEEADPNAVDPATISTDPPADALVLEPIITPRFILAEARNDPDTVGGYQDAWLSERGWEGEVMSVSKSGGLTTITIDAGHITSIGPLHVVCQTPDPGNVAKGGLARIRGRIASVTFTTNALLIPSRIYLDHCKVLNFMKPG